MTRHERLLLLVALGALVLFPATAGRQLPGGPGRDAPAAASAHGTGSAGHGGRTGSADRARGDGGRASGTPTSGSAPGPSGSTTGPSGTGTGPSGTGTGTVGGIGGVGGGGITGAGASTSGPAAPSSPGTTTPSTPSGTPGSPGDAGPPPPPASCPASSGAPRHEAPGSGLTIALTFDDGPGPDTRAVLDVLAARHVHATFFVVGRAVAADPAAAARAVAEGHQLGNHTWSHTYPRNLRQGWTVPYLRDQLDRTDAAVTAATGRPTCVFRPPGGFLPPSVAVAGRQTREQVVLWSVDPRDWEIQGRHDPGPAGRVREANAVYAAAITGVGQAHPILLLHDSGGYRGATVAALPRIIAYYQAHGYRFVRLDGRP